MYEWFCCLCICWNGCFGMLGWGFFEDVYMGLRVNVVYVC